VRDVFNPSYAVVGKDEFGQLFQFFKTFDALDEVKRQDQPFELTQRTQILNAADRVHLQVQ
jgi:hypothetical protein